MYLPTHRRKTEGRSDAILYRNLCREVEKALENEGSREIVNRLKELDREEFWEDGKMSDGLAVFAAQGFLAAYRLPAQFPELEVVGQTFHTKPLIRFLQSNSLTYHLLALNIRRVALYEGLGDAIHEVPLRGVPLSPAEEAVGEGPVPSRSGERLPYGQASTKEQAKTDLEKFFRSVGKELWKNHLRSSNKVLILAAPAQHQSLFRKVAQIPTLIETGVVVDPARLTPEELRTEARRVLEPEIKSRIAKAKDEFGLARSRAQGTDVLQDIARLVVKGRVRLLFVETGRRVWGKLDATTGEIVLGDQLKDAHDVDLLDELAELTLVRGGEVFVLPKGEMPSATGIAAILRF